MRGFDLIGRALAICALSMAALPGLAQSLPQASYYPQSVLGGVVDSVGPGDTLSITVFGQPELNAQVTIDGNGDIVVPFLGRTRVLDMAPAAIGQHIADGLRRNGYLQDPQVAVEVAQVRSRVVSVLGEVARPGRYPLEGRLTLLEVLAVAGGLRDDAADTAVLLRQGASPTAGQQRQEVYVGNQKSPVQQVQDVELRSGDIVYVAQAARVYVYGEVLRGGAFAIEPGLNVMRALSLAGGLTQRGSQRRVTISRTDPDSGQVVRLRARLTDPVLAGDVIHVNERIF